MSADAAGARNVLVANPAGGALTEAQVREHCRGRLAAYKLPKYVEFVPGLPKSAVGKTLRRLLRSQLSAEQTA
jgi:long-chain acyl-CoA synthetase